MGKRNNRERAPRHVRLYHYMTNTPAWHDLNAVARAIYIEIAKRYAGVGSNNGRIPYSVREAAAELKIGTATASRALGALVDHGFIVSVTKGAFSRKVRHATEWRLTEFPCDVTNTPIGTKDYMRWQQSTASTDQPTQSGMSKQLRHRARSAPYPLAN
jgi:DNA-binding transcriptional MocR family regulator